MQSARNTHLAPYKATPRALLMQLHIPDAGMRRGLTGTLDGLTTKNACNGNLKIISALHLTPAELLPIEDLATASLDCLTQEQGYRRFVPL